MKLFSWMPVLALVISFPYGEPLNETLTSQHRFDTLVQCNQWFVDNEKNVVNDLKQILADEKLEHPDATNIEPKKGCIEVEQPTTDPRQGRPQPSTPARPIKEIPII